MPKPDVKYILLVDHAQVLGTDDFLELSERYEDAVATYGRDHVEARRDGQPFRPGPSRLIQRFSYKVTR